MPTLDAIQIRLPCTASWEAMVGDERRRFCGLCQKPVYNLSAMTCDEARAVLAADVPPCVRFSRLADGRVATLDRAARLVGIAGAALAAACTPHPDAAPPDPAFGDISYSASSSDPVSEPSVLIPEATEPVTTTTTEPVVHPLMGKPAVHRTPPPEPRMLMGEPVMPSEPMMGAVRAPEP